MNKKLLFGYLSLVLFFCSCNSKPSNKELEKKILLDYICAETAKVNSLKILNTRETESIAGNKAYEFTVSGEVEWESGCNEFGSRIPEGFKETFENKKVYLAKGEQGWQ